MTSNMVGCEKRLTFVDILQASSLWRNVLSDFTIGVGRFKGQVCPKCPLVFFSKGQNQSKAMGDFAFLFFKLRPFSPIYPDLSVSGCQPSSRRC